MKIALSVILIASALSFVGCNRLTEQRLIGAWRAEDGEGVAELYLNRDHTFRNLNTFKEEFVTPSVIEETGIWSFQDGQLHLNGVVTWSKQPWKTTLRLIKLRINELVVRGTEATKDASFVRLHVPTCLESLSPAKRAPSEKDLFGVWRVHWSTHDYEYSFNEDHSFFEAAPINGEFVELDHGIWRLSGADLMLQFKEHTANSANDAHLAIIHVGTNCLSIKVSTEDRPYTFVRRK